MEWIIQLPILFFSVVVHEIAHGLVAYEKGDDTAEAAGRLTLNPIPHIDPFGTVFLPVFCYLLRLPMFAWAKPVPVNSSRLRRPRRDLIQVALIGPGVNLFLSLVAAVLFKLAAAMSFLSTGFLETVLNALIFAVSINLFLAFFNLIPIHPLDGSQVLSGLLPLSLRRRYNRHAPYGMLIIVLLMMTKLLYPLVIIPSQFALSLYSRAGLLW